MKSHIHLNIRTRLLVAYIGVLAVGFFALTLLAGQQISTAARVDFEQRLQNNVRLLAQGLGSELAAGTSQLDDLIAEYEQQLGAHITLDTTEPRTTSRVTKSSSSPEIEAAFRGETIVVERRDDKGNETLFTAMRVAGQSDDHHSVAGVVQLSVPLSDLQNVIWQRWLSLGLVFGLIILMSLGGAVIVARSIIRPLEALRESAVKLSIGDFSHRVAYNGEDEIGQVARAFNLMAKEVQSMLEEQRAFASNTSHELRTPLTTIRLRSEALRYDADLDLDIHDQYIVEIDDEANRMGALIEDLTVLSRFDAGRAELGNNQIDPLHLATNIYRRFRQECEAKNLQLSLDTPESIPPIHASISHMTVVFRNILDNAIKYTPEGGSINWSLRAEADGVCSSITDTGRGMEEEELTHIFERFYRADKARSRDVPGSGLGLAIVKSIVEAYGGSITIKSEGRGKGTTVNILLPYKPLAAQDSGEK